MKTEAWLNARLFFVPFFNPGENENDGENENKSVPAAQLVSPAGGETRCATFRRRGAWEMPETLEARLRRNVN